MALEGEVRRIADVVLARIVGGTYPAGLRLPSEVEIAGELGCGRSTVREALRHLADLGVVASRRGSGARVLDFRREGTPSLLPPYLASGRFDLPPGVLAQELLHLRAVLAGEAVRLAARYAPSGSLRRARALLDEAIPGDAVAHAMRELELFRELVCASGVWPAVWLANAYWAPLRELHRRLAPVVGGPPDDFVPAMRALLDLVERRDEHGATDHVRRWLAGVDAALLAALEPALSQGAAPLAGGPRP